ncbi:MAG: CBS domain-containing protein [Desulfobacteraceae bacterium]|jgi:CBS domain-containing protein|nr:CBS domain-containing protein [Desulfobacteraceae bacterium]
MLKAKDIMAREVITVTTSIEIVQAAKILIENNINGLPVVDDDGALVGILCQSDLIAQQKNIPVPSLFTLLDGFIPLTSLKKVERDIQKITAITVADAMTEDPVSVNSDTGIGEVAELMVDKNFHSIPVVDDGKLVGIIGKEDVLQTLIKK